MFEQHAVQFGKGLHRCTWWTQGQGRADTSVQHPASDSDDDSFTDLYMQELTRGAALAIHSAQSATVQRMPKVEDFNFLPDMGRVNRNWYWQDRTGSSQDRCEPARERRR